MGRMLLSAGEFSTLIKNHHHNFFYPYFLGPFFLENSPVLLFYLAFLYSSSFLLCVRLTINIIYYPAVELCIHMVISKILRALKKKKMKKFLLFCVLWIILSLQTAKKKKKAYPFSLPFILFFFFFGKALWIKVKKLKSLELKKKVYLAKTCKESRKTPKERLIHLKSNQTPTCPRKKKLKPN